jgi:hypothetical protein
MLHKTDDLSTRAFLLHNLDSKVWLAKNWIPFSWQYVCLDSGIPTIPHHLLNYTKQTISQKYTSVFIYSSSTPGSIEWFIEVQAFPRSNDLAPPSPLSSPLSTVRKLDRRHTERLRKRDNLQTGQGGGGGARSRIIRTARNLEETLVLY